MKKTLLALPVIAVLLLSACSGQSDPPVKILNSFRGSVGVPGTDPSSMDTPTIYWTNDKRTKVALTTAGSSSCPIYPVKLHVSSSTSIELTMKTYSEPCTADLAPYTSEFALPENVSRTATVKISLDQEAGAKTMITGLSLKPSPTTDTKLFVDPIKH